MLVARSLKADRADAESADVWFLWLAMSHATKKMDVVMELIISHFR
jgi:hypothetical protein